MSTHYRTVALAAIVWHVWHQPANGNEVDTSPRANAIRDEKRLAAERQLHAAVEAMLAADEFQIHEDRKAGDGLHPAPACSQTP